MTCPELQSCTSSLTRLKLRGEASRKHERMQGLRQSDRRRERDTAARAQRWWEPYGARRCSLCLATAAGEPPTGVAGALRHRHWQQISYERAILAFVASVTVPPEVNSRRPRVRFPGVSWAG
jgi:hypothetical protein